MVRQRAAADHRKPRRRTLPAGGPRLTYAPDGADADPYAGFEARIVPENITLLPKSAAQSERPECAGTSARSP